MRVQASGRRWLLTLGFSLSLQTALTEGPAEPQSPEALTDQIRHMLPKSPAWEAWLERSGELAPDFSSMPGIAGLPAALQLLSGEWVRHRSQWPARRRELLELFQHYITGTVPPAPGNVRVVERSRREESGVAIEELTLGFGPDERARLHIELILPSGPGPFPVFVTQENHRRWALVAVSRGYLACVYAGADSRDDTAAWAGIWPQHDWTKLTRRAWAASRCIDYLVTRPEVDGRRIALTGHSRNAKTSLIAAALDERIGAVISSSSGAGGACSWRFFSETEFGESIELITRVFPDWLHPRLRFFAGRENKLPIDQHELIACIAPRPCLISTALNDNVESAWAVEQTLAAARPVFKLLGHPDALALRYRTGAHETDAEDIESYVDWLDQVFGRRQGRGTLLPSQPIFPTYPEWLRLSRERIDPRRFPERFPADLLSGSQAGRPAQLLPSSAKPPRLDNPVTARTITTVGQWQPRQVEIRRQLEWLLGEAPPLPTSVPGDYGAEPNYVAEMLGREATLPALHKDSLNFGAYVRGDLYYPTNVLGTARRLPCFIWLHPISVSNGYEAGYHRGEAPHLTLTRSGYAVFAFDQIGNGGRLEELRSFYPRHPHWSLLGKTVADTRAAVDAVRSHPHVDPDQVFLVGYGTGSMAALCAAALDDRVAGAIAVAGIMPFRKDTPDRGTGGIARWSQWLPLLPRLGAFVGQENRVPCDWDEILALIAPRSVLLIAPGIDYQTDFADLRTCVDRARPVFDLLGAGKSLVFQRTADYNHFTPDLIWCLCGVETIR